MRTICKQCHRAQEIGPRGGIRIIALNRHGLCPACVCANAEVAYEANLRLSADRSTDHDEQHESTRRHPSRVRRHQPYL
jgi:hypothetical protein